MTGRSPHRLLLAFGAITMLVTPAIATGSAGATTATALTPATTNCSSVTPPLVTDPTTLLGGAPTTLLRSIAQRTWSFEDLVDLDGVTALPRNSVPTAPRGVADHYTSPTDIGLALDAEVAAHDLGFMSSSQTSRLLQRQLATIGELQKSDGFLLDWYDTATGAAVAAPANDAPAAVAASVSTVDNGWFAEGLVTAGQAFPSLRPTTTSLLSAMKWPALVSSTQHLLTGGLQGAAQVSSTLNLAYGGSRVADDMAIGSRTVPGSLLRLLSQLGRSGVGGGYDSYDGVNFVPTFNGSLFEALAPDQVMPDQTWGPRSLGLNDDRTVTAQICYAEGQLHYPVWGLAPAAAPLPARNYLQYGSPALSADHRNVPGTAVTPYASFLALNVQPMAAYANIAVLMERYPAIYEQYGFVDSVDPTTSTVAGRYMGLSQMTILLSLDNALDHDRLQGYFAASPQGKAIAPYISEQAYGLP